MSRIESDFLGERKFRMIAIMVFRHFVEKIISIH